MVGFGSFEDDPQYKAAIQQTHLRTAAAGEYLWALRDAHNRAAHDMIDEYSHQLSSTFDDAGRKIQGGVPKMDLEDENIQEALDDLQPEIMGKAYRAIRIILKMG